MPVFIANSDILSADPKLTQWNFPGGEVGVKLEDLDISEHYTVVANGIVSSDDIFKLLNILDALHRKGVPSVNVSVFMPYLPYARQDRVCNEGESNALHVFCQVLATAKHKFYKLYVTDLHSEVSEIYLKEFVGRLVHTRQYQCTDGLPLFNCIVAPDQGAVEKSKLTQPEALHINLTKRRTGGKVKSYLEDNLKDNILGSACIVDDICDGGATFIAAAKILRATQPRMTTLSLYVTHGIFSKGIEELQQYFDEIYCYNLMSSDKEVQQKVLIV